MKNSVTESIKSQTNDEENMKKLPGSKIATLNLNGKSWRKKIPQQQHASVPRTNPQVDGSMKQLQQQTKGKLKQQTKSIPKNVTKQQQLKTKGGTTAAAKMKSSKKDILRSQSNEDCKSAWPSLMRERESKNMTKND